MTSSCSDAAGTLAYHVTALMASESNVTCSVRPLTDDYQGDTLVLLFAMKQILSNEVSEASAAVQAKQRQQIAKQTFTRYNVSAIATISRRWTLESH